MSLLPKSKNIVIFALFALAMIFLPSTKIILAENYIQVKALDTVSGFETILKAENADSYEQFSFLISKPDGEKLQISAQADAGGRSNVTLYDYHTRKAGVYRVQAQNPRTGELGQSADFQVYPDELDVGSSGITANKLSAKADGRDQILLGVKVSDKYGNPLANRQIKIISSRKTDKIARAGETEKTDQNGVINFYLAAIEPGLSTYGAVDLNSGLTLEERIKVAYFQDAPRDVGGDSIFSFAGASVLHAQAPAAATSSGIPQRFEIKNLADRLEPNKSYSFRVEAVDVSGKKVNAYSGNVRFTVTDPNASIPPDYTFEPNDLGGHDFSLALRFATPGGHKLAVIDTNNTNLRGEFMVNVSGGAVNTANNQKTTTNNPQTDKAQTETANKKVTAIATEAGQRTAPLILAPVAGIYKKKDISVSGKAGVGDQLVLFDNDRSAANFAAGADGKFSVELKNLSDGEHKLRVGLTDGTGRILGFSSSLTIKIDANAPGVDEVKILPKDTVTRGASVILKVYSDMDVAEAAVIINNKIYELNKDLSEPGAYSASIPAPAAIGDYPVNVIIIDRLGNETSASAAATLKVVQDNTLRADGGVTSSTTANSTLPSLAIQGTELPGSPSQPKNLQAQNSDGRVTLAWEASTDNTFVQKYRVFYGIKPQDLIVAINTFDAATRWYVPNLTNGQTYYFAVAGIDSEGNVGQLTGVIDGKPAAGVNHPIGDNKVEGENKSGTSGIKAGVITGSSDLNSKASKDKSSAPVQPPISSRTPETGPETVMLILFSFILSGLGAYWQINREEKSQSDFQF